MHARYSSIRKTMRGLCAGEDSRKLIDKIFSIEPLYESSSPHFFPYRVAGVRKRCPHHSSRFVAKGQVGDASKHRDKKDMKELNNTGRLSKEANAIKHTENRILLAPSPPTSAKEGKRIHTLFLRLRDLMQYLGSTCLVYLFLNFCFLFSILQKLLLSALFYV